MSGSGGEIPEGHAKRAADLAFERVHRAGEAIRRKPFRERIRLEKRSVDLVGLRDEHAMQTHGIGHDRPPVTNPSAPGSRALTAATPVKIPRVKTSLTSLRAAAGALCMLLAAGVLHRAVSAEDAKPLTAILIKARGELRDPFFGDSVVLVMNN